MIGCAYATPPDMPARTERLESLWSWQSGQPNLSKWVPATWSRRQQPLSWPAKAPDDLWTAVL